MSVLQVKNLTLGGGHPKIAVPITGKTVEEILSVAKQINHQNADLIEWRIDFFEDVLDKEKLIDAAGKLRAELADFVILITFRTHFEGGNMPLAENQYFEICKNVITEKLADLVDLEMFRKTSEIKKLTQLAHEKNVFVIMSSHDFKQTPAITEIKRRFTMMDAYGADILKVAVMPNSAQDVLTLLAATNQAVGRFDKPLITMAMGDLGKVTRVAGEVFGSCLTFGTVGAASAPGQIDSPTLREMMDALKLE